MKTSTKDFYYKFILFFMVLCTIFISVQGAFSVCFAESGLNFDNTDVVDDLKASTINGEVFDFTKYAFDMTKELKILNIVEYCYDSRAECANNYGLYLYIYNPRKLKISDSSSANMVQMGVEWKTASDGSVTCSRYEKFYLKLCSKSTGDYDGLYYKFKVIDRSIDGKSMYDRVNASGRRYDISGIELLISGNKKVTDFNIGISATFTGYAAGYGTQASSDKSTLSAKVKDLETLELNVHSTTYRTGVSDKGENHFDQVSTVYFSVPNRFFEDYGNLQKIRAQWYEYKTKMAIITSSQEVCDEYKNYVYGETAPLSTYVSSYLDGYYCEWASFGASTGTNVVFNTNRKLYTGSSYVAPWVFYSEVEDDNDVFSFFKVKGKAGDVSASEVAEYMYNYPIDYNTPNVSIVPYYTIGGTKISSSLFTNDVDEGRTRGFNDQTIDLEDTFDLISYDENHSWWDKLCTFGFSWPETTETLKGISPIEVLDPDDNPFGISELKNLTDSVKERISNEYLIGEDDVYDFLSFYLTESVKGNRVVLFRFAKTDYFCSNAYLNFYYDDGQLRTLDAYGIFNLTSSSNTYLAQQTLFLDFDIIELTFTKDGVASVIPVVSSPIDVIGGFTDKNSGGVEWWKVILMVLALILFIVIIYPILPYVIKAIVWIITLPFKLIGKLIKAFKKKE